MKAILKLIHQSKGLGIIFTLGLILGSLLINIFLGIFIFLLMGALYFWLYRVIYLIPKSREWSGYDIRNSTFEQKFIKNYGDGTKFCEYLISAHG